MLKECYANGEITHEEYERRLQVLLDVDNSDELQRRLEGVTIDARTR
ncbi:SHOCT domain-containing protein [Halobacteria archaeon AArc-curdl1]|uniref:SHOCT domain-containing protein n=1 Tax=Natronosalvus hydrolyticus TaxID=2979988 RepID=A0AAP3E733_9EURY|nr:SHOCT domain-containing protein [Halobacteria archaeon AArc-curdl1]